MAGLRTLLETLADIPAAPAASIRSKSRDFFWFSPILKSQLEGKHADVVFIPENREQLARIAAGCARNRVPLTVRGGGTGNYGQAVPLFGGVVLDMSHFNRVVHLEAGAGRFEAGARLLDIDKELREERWELRFFPSTRRQATIGGFIAGGAGGVGSCTWGQLADPGAVSAIQVLTVEETPRYIELRGRDVRKVLHAYGVNGIITEVEMPLAPWMPWAERIFCFPSLSRAVAFAHTFTAAEGFAKKLVSVHDERVSRMIPRLGTLVSEGAAMVLTMVSEPQAPLVEELAEDFDGKAVYRRSAPDAERAAFEGRAGLPPIYEYAWNHTTWHAIKSDPTITYLQIRLPAGQEAEAVEELCRKLGDEVILHLEFQRRGGRVFVSGLPLVRFQSPERLRALVEMIEAAGVAVSNPHSYLLDDAGWKRVDAPQGAFKRQADPFGVMNPGKLASTRDTSFPLFSSDPSAPDRHRGPASQYRRVEC